MGLQSKSTVVAVSFLQSISDTPPMSPTWQPVLIIWSILAWYNLLKWSARLAAVLEDCRQGDQWLSLSTASSWRQSIIDCGVDSDGHSSLTRILQWDLSESEEIVTFDVSFAFDTSFSRSDSLSWSVKCQMTISVSGAGKNPATFWTPSIARRPSYKMRPEVSTLMDLCLTIKLAYLVLQPHRQILLLPPVVTSPFARGGSLPMDMVAREIPPGGMIARGTPPRGMVARGKHHQWIWLPGGYDAPFLPMPTTTVA